MAREKKPAIVCKSAKEIADRIMKMIKACSLSVQNLYCGGLINENTR